MLNEILKYLGLYLLACLKTVLAPLAGTAAGASQVEIILISVAGLMTSVFIFSFLGEKIKTKVIPKFVKNPKRFSKQSRRMVKLWKRYGIVGVCFLTPFLLSPAAGTLIVSSVGAPRKQVFVYMLIFGIFWSVVWTLSIDWLISLGLFESSEVEMF